MRLFIVQGYASILDEMSRYHSSSPHVDHNINAILVDSFMIEFMLTDIFQQGDPFHANYCYFNRVTER
jgi:hypothetical protein